MRNRLRISFGLLVVSLLSFAAISYFSNLVQAQTEPIPLPQNGNGIFVDPSTPEFTPLEGDMADYLIESDFVDKSLSDYQIVYLSNEPTDFSSKLSGYIPFVAVSSWEQFLELNESQSVDALIIHTSALEVVDQSWVAQAFRRGVTIVTINIERGNLRELLALPKCTENDKEIADDFFVIKSFLVLADKPEDALFIQHQLDECVKTEIVTDGLVVTSDSTTKNQLTSDEEFKFLKDSLLTDLNSTARTKYEFEIGFYTGDLN